MIKSDEVKNNSSEYDEKSNAVDFLSLLPNISKCIALFFKITTTIVGIVFVKFKVTVVF